MHLALKRASAAFLREHGCRVVAAEVPCPFGRYRVDVAGYADTIGGRQEGLESGAPRSGVRPLQGRRCAPRTVFIECKANRSDFRRDALDHAPLEALRDHLARVRETILARAREADAWGVPADAAAPRPRAGTMRASLRAGAHVGAGSALPGNADVCDRVHAAAHVASDGSAASAGTTTPKTDVAVAAAVPATLATEASAARSSPRDCTAGGTLFAELAASEEALLRSRSYRSVLRRLHAAERRMHGATKFATLLRYRLADRLYIAAPQGLLRPRDLPEGWGLLEAPRSTLEEGDPSADLFGRSVLCVRVRAQPLDSRETYRVRVLRNIAVTASAACARELGLRT